jgi:EF-P beta-lysylation protein EpmB
MTDARPDVAITRLPELLAALDLEDRPGLAVANLAAEFPLRVTREFVARMRQADPDDPLLRQVFPAAQEALEIPGYGHDPVGDLASMRAPGVLRKYDGRALLIVTGACAIHCRYCFRRAFPYAENALRPRQVAAALAGIAADATIAEVILSGGDPLSLSNARLGDLLERIGRIPHVLRVRIHTRHPVALPARVDAALCRMLSRAPRPVVVIHANHANELDDAVAAAMSRLSEVTHMLLNQSVLLRGVNDSVAALVALSERLFAIGVTPYYLHQLDPVAGAAHFAVADQDARRLIEKVRAMLPGYLVPRLVREHAGADAKQPV